MTRIRATFDRQGNPVEDPWAVLGVAPGSPAEAVRDAYRTLVVAHPPERDAEGFQRIHRSYRRLADDAAVEERHHGVLEIGGPADYGLPASGGERPGRDPERLLLGELLLYAVAEALAAVRPSGPRSSRCRPRPRDWIRRRRSRARSTVR